MSVAAPNVLRSFAWLILLVQYMPQLAPQVPKNVPEADSIWQKSNEFMDDYIYANNRAHLGCKSFGAENHGGTIFTKMLCRIETWAWGTIQRYQKKKSQTPAERQMKPECMCGMHDPSNPSFRIKAPHQQAHGNAQLPDDDFYDYPYIDEDIEDLLGSCLS